VIDSEPHLDRRNFAKKDAQDPQPTHASGHRLKGPARVESRLMFLPTRVEDGTLFYVWQER